jgi:hypothetical protein
MNEPQLRALEQRLNADAVTTVRMPQLNNTVKTRTTA